MIKLLKTINNKSFYYTGSKKSNKYRFYLVLFCQKIRKSVTLRWCSVSYKAISRRVFNVDIIRVLGCNKNRNLDVVLTIYC